jgi:hypothetical protein
MRALSGEIIVHPNGKHNTRDKLSVKQNPVHVALLLDEKKFMETKGAMIHHGTVFLLDRTHDWEYCDKTSTIRVYGSIDPDDPLPVVVAYKVTE